MLYCDILRICIYIYIYISYPETWWLYHQTTFCKRNQQNPFLGPTSRTGILSPCRSAIPSPATSRAVVLATSPCVRLKLSQSLRKCYGEIEAGLDHWWGNLIIYHNNGIILWYCYCNIINNAIIISITIIYCTRVLIYACIIYIYVCVSHMYTVPH